MSSDELVYFLGVNRLMCMSRVLSCAQLAKVHKM